MDFGKTVKVGNYGILKYSKSLTKKEVAVLRKGQNIPDEVRGHLERAKLPYIKVFTLSGSWEVHFVIGTSMYEALDALKVAHDSEGNNYLYGVEAQNTEAIFVGMLADTTTVGDYEYQVAKQKALHEYIERASAKANEDEDAGKSPEQIQEENDKAAQEILDASKTKEALIDMSNHINAKEDEAK